jgi:alanine dehydrogenase
MVIGSVREIKDNEYRVGLVPGGVTVRPECLDSDGAVL